MEDCVFCKIVRGEIPADFVHKGDDFCVFSDIEPAAPLHLLFVPTKHIEEFTEISIELLGAMKSKVVEIVQRENLLERGYRFLVNGGKAKAVSHLHLHLLGEVDVARKLNGA